MKAQIFKEGLVSGKKLILVFLSACVVVLSFTSCQKEITGELPEIKDSLPTASTLVKTYTEDITFSASNHQVETYNLSYDSSERLLSMIGTSNPGNKFIYQYSDSLYTMDIYNDNLVSIHELFFLNNLSLVDSTLQYNDTNDTVSEKYIYNSANQLTILRVYDYSSVFGTTLSNTHNYSYDAAGNTTNESDNSSVITYEYYTNLLNTLNFGQFYSNRNTNLTKTTTSTSGGSPDIVEHTYTFDNQNRLSSEKEIANNGIVVIKSYTY